jgi:hypothetical protein
MTLNPEELRSKMARWVDHLKSVRVFRPMKINAEVYKDGRGWLSVTVTDGLYTFKTQPFHFHVATMEWPVLYENLELMLVEAFKAHVRTMTAPELVLEGTLGVEVVKAETDGEEKYVFI